MKFSDFLLSSGIYLCIGVIVYYLFTAVIIHLRSFLQPCIYQKTVAPEKPFEDYTYSFIRDFFTQFRLHVYVLNYISPFTKTSFPSIGNKQIDRVVIVLETIRNYIIPFLICGGIFFILRLFINGHIPHDISNTTFAEIQLAINELNSYEILRFIFENKIIVNCILAFLIALVPVLFLRLEKMKKYLKRFNLLLVFIAILTNITFFTGEVGSDYYESKKELVDIEMKLQKVHDNIYAKIIAQELIDNNLGEFQKEYSQYQKLYDELELKKEENINSISDNTLRYKLKEQYLIINDTIYETKLKIPSLYTSKKEPRVSIEFKELREHFQKGTMAQISEQVEYLFNDDYWTLTKGNELKTEVENTIHLKQQKQLLSQQSPKLYNFIYNILFKALSDFGLSVLSDYLPDTGNDLLITGIKAIRNSTQQDQIKSIQNFFTNRKENNPIVSQLKDSEAVTSIRNKFNSLFDEFKIQDDEKKVQKEIRIQENLVKTKIEDALFSQVIEDFKNIDYNLVTINDEKSTSEQIKELESNRATFLDNSERYRKEIMSNYSGFITSAYAQTIKQSGNMKPSQYLSYLKMLDGKAIIHSNNFFKTPVKTTSQYIPNIHWACGLDMNIVKKCPVVFVKIR